jgi:hypothetical protein
MGRHKARTQTKREQRASVNHEGWFDGVPKPYGWVQMRPETRQRYQEDELCRQDELLRQEQELFGKTEAEQDAELAKAVQELGL